MAPINLSNKVCIVTGGNRGIGLAFVKQLLAKGNTVFAGCRNPASFPAAGAPGARVLELDVASPESIESFAAAVAAEAPHVDLVVNNAGVMIGYRGLQDTTAENMLETYKVNTVGPVLLVKALREKKLLGGRKPSLIGNVSSKVGSCDDNKSGGGYAYRASKAALNVVSVSMSVDLAGDNVECVVLHPGYVRTAMVNNNGLIDADTSAAGLLSVIESGKPLNGKWYDYKHEEIKW